MTEHFVTWYSETKIQVKSQNGKQDTNIFKEERYFLLNIFDNCEREVKIFINTMFS